MVVGRERRTKAWLEPWCWAWPRQDWPSQNFLRIVLKERNPWLTPTESSESDETEVEEVKPFRAPPGLPDPLFEETRIQKPMMHGWETDRESREPLAPEVQTNNENWAAPGDRQREGQRRAEWSDSSLNSELERGAEERQSCKPRGGILPHYLTLRGRFALSRDRTNCRATVSHLPGRRSAHPSSLMVWRSRKWSRAHQSNTHEASNTGWFGQGSGGRSSTWTARTQLSLRTWATRRRRGATLQSSSWTSSGRSQRETPTVKAKRRRWARSRHWKNHFRLLRRMFSLCGARWRTQDVVAASY